MLVKWSKPASAYLNGEFMPLEEIRVSALDRGFLFGDGVYELIPGYGRRLFRLPEHLRRLTRSLSAVRIANPYGDTRWKEILYELVARAEWDDLTVYMQVTRGVAPRDHAFPQRVSPTVFAMTNPYEPPDGDVLEHGIAAITLEDIRWHRCDIKAITLLGNILLRQQALDAGAMEAVLIREGYATEGAATNLFIVQDGVIITPPNGPNLLPGITRDLVSELASRHGLPIQERPIPQRDLLKADEIWLTSSSNEVLPVTRLNDKTVGDGLPGPLWLRVHGLFQAYKADLGASPDIAARV